MRFESRQARDKGWLEPAKCMVGQRNEIDFNSRRDRRGAGQFCQEILTAETTDSYVNFPPALIGGPRLPK
jgi:hypothetical protein